tara:strand:+ start:13869 stop:14150 length:282 start_codon:yes stop_codon:yes gene_type:complete
VLASERGECFKERTVGMCRRGFEEVFDILGVGDELRADRCREMAEPNKPWSVVSSRELDGAEVVGRLGLEILKRSAERSVEGRRGRTGWRAID